VVKTDPLAQLKDIHLPNPVGFWPLAPGWYVLSIFILFLMCLFAFWLHKRHRHAVAKKQALKLLAHYQKQHEKASTTAAHISELLRRVALVYYPRAQVASLQGDAWLQFLNKTGKGIDFNPIRPMLLDLPFKQEEAVNLSPLFHKAQLWIKQRKVPCSN
jgi:cbb3-type cytochrome oxidase subunit 3